MNEMKLFESKEFGQIRGLEVNGEPWLAGKDVAAALGYQNASKALQDHVDDEDKLNNESLSSLGQRGGWLINESGLYSLILSSKLPGAKRFKRWVTSEVLPAIRRDGGYMKANAEETPEEIMARALKIADATMKRQQEQIEEMKPKALFADAVAASDGTCLIGELAKMLTQAGFTVGQNRLFSMMRCDGFLGKNGCNRNVTLQRYVEKGLFKIKETAVTHADGHVTINRTPKVTGKGQRYFMKYFTEKMTAPNLTLVME